MTATYLHSSKPIILASASPRRQQLLHEAGFRFEVFAPNVDETYPADMPVAEVPEYLATLKANAILPQFASDTASVILAADSVVILNNLIFGKPANASDAKNILRQLAGHRHDVITGVCLCNRDKQVRFSVTSSVFIDNLSDAEIDYYITQYQPFDKAGAYGIQEWLGLCKVARIEGSYSNIMGLPMREVYQHILAF
ncbi:MAG: septum formation protein Maf [Saprospiraceae bacterium]|nr:septum formation protein Maf [Saprospiraceae bacterium]MBP7699026.1 septum formation protein Maf [Saprospiraceae bacterium]